MGEDRTPQGGAEGSAACIWERLEEGSAESILKCFPTVEIFIVCTCLRQTPPDSGSGFDSDSTGACIESFSICIRNQNRQKPAPALVLALANYPDTMTTAYGENSSDSECSPPIPLP
ncbi:uncharacterized protein DMAD_05021 [Drosophila madeirensis]|uniref:Uncharacterized protein n=1 Tax=Drosophila madeirensis TaxID=30013 RepID=A0AAU9GFW2_DROMD